MHKTFPFSSVLCKFLYIQQISVFNFFCISLFWAALQCLYLWNRKVNFHQGFQQNVVLNMRHTLKLETRFSFYSSSFCLIASHMKYVYNFKICDFWERTAWYVNFACQQTYWKQEKWVFWYKTQYTYTVNLRRISVNMDIFSMSMTI